MSALSLRDEVAYMRRLFDGRRDVYGVAKGNVERAGTGDLSEERWDGLFERHLSGDAGADLGIYPVRDDDTVTFAAIDIDEPDFDLAQELADLLPAEHVFIEKSRSGNYHVFVFFDAPLEAYFARAVLRGAILGAARPDLEIFPKQGGLKEGMIGNYISIPFHGDARPIVWSKSGAWGGQGVYLPRPNWLAYADVHRTSAELWQRKGRALGGKPRSEERSGEFGNRNSLHVCANHIFEHRHDNPVTEGHRATVLFNLAKMYANCVHYSEEEAMRFVQAVNEAGTNPVPEREVQRFVHNAYEGGFTSTGCDDPLMGNYVSPDCKIAQGG